MTTEWSHTSIIIHAGTEVHEVELTHSESDPPDKNVTIYLGLNDAEGTFCPDLETALAKMAPLILNSDGMSRE